MPDRIKGLLDEVIKAGQSQDVKYTSLPTGYGIEM